MPNAVWKKGGHACDPCWESKSTAVWCFTIHINVYIFRPLEKKVIISREKKVKVSTSGYWSFKPYCFKAFQRIERGYVVFLVQKSIFLVAGFSEIKSCFDLGMLMQNPSMTLTGMLLQLYSSLTFDIKLVFSHLPWLYLWLFSALLEFSIILN